MKFLTIAAILFFPLVSLGQTQETSHSIEWGKWMKEPSGTRMIKLVSPSDKGFYAVREKTGGEGAEGPQKYIIEKYGPDYTLIKAEAIDIRHQKKKRSLVDILNLEGRIWMLSSFTNKKHQQTYLFAEEISKEDLRPSGDLIPIASTINRSMHRRGTFFHAISEDSSRIVVYNPLSDEKKGPKGIVLSVFDGNFNKVWSKDVKFRSDFFVEEYKVDNKGIVYVLGHSIRETKRGESLEYELITYSENGSIRKSYPITVPDALVSEVSFKIDIHGDVYCAGFYSGQDLNGIRGAFFFKIDTDKGLIQNARKTELGLDFLTLGLSAKKANKALEAARKGDDKNYPELENFRLEKLIVRSDGGVVLIAEQFYIRERRDNYYGPYSYYDYYSPFYSPFYSPYYSSYNYNRAGSYYEFNYNDIVVLNIGPDGVIDWQVNIPKAQETMNDGGRYSSFAMINVKDKLHFLFNDNPKNYGNESGKLYVYDGGFGFTTQATLRLDGEVNYEPLLGQNDTPIVLQPIMFQQIAGKKMILFGRSGKQFRFGKLIYN
jgi:hypothetical protein